MKLNLLSVAVLMANDSMYGRREDELEASYYRARSVFVLKADRILSDDFAVRFNQVAEREALFWCKRQIS